MVQLVLKGSRYMEGHSYATASGYKFHWTAARSEARRFADDDPMAQVFARLTRARLVREPNTRRELKELGRREMCRRQAPPFATRISRI